MKILLLTIGCLLSLNGMSQIEIQTKNASVTFNYVEEKTEGTLNEVEATIKLNTADLLASKIKGSVKVETISTGNKMRDKHLKSKDYFNVEEYPLMKFESKVIKKEGSQYKAEGKLTIKDITNDVVFDVMEIDGIMQLSTSIFADDFDVAIRKSRDKSTVEVTVSVPLNP